MGRGREEHADCIKGMRAWLPRDAYISLCSGSLSRDPITALKEMKKSLTSEYPPEDRTSTYHVRWLFVAALTCLTHSEACLPSLQTRLRVTRSTGDGEALGRTTPIRRIMSPSRCVRKKELRPDLAA